MTSGGSQYVQATISNFPNTSIKIKCMDAQGYKFPEYTVSTSGGNHTYTKSQSQAVCLQEHGIETWVRVTLNGSVFDSNHFS